jgi:CRISPR system Cascade subunit CasA
MMMKPNLIDHPWLPVSVGGRSQLVGLRTALRDSHQIDSLALAPATAWVAVLRQVVLPLVADVFGFPQTRPEWARRHSQGRFDARTLDQYLSRHYDRFYLFDDVAPFAQVAGLTTTKGDLKPVSLLIPSVPTGNNVPLFGSRTDNDPPPLPWSQAVIWLLHTQCWDTAGLKTGAAGDPAAKGGKTTGNPTGPLGALGVVVPTGPNLFETLMLNLPIVMSVPTVRNWPADSPQWRRPPLEASWRERAATGFLDLWTWQARRIRLVPSAEAGEVEPVVKEALVTSGDRLQAVPDFEPHTGWSFIKKPTRGDPPRRARRHRSGRAAWRGLDGLVAGGNAEAAPSLLLLQAGELQADGFLDEGYPLGVTTAGIEYGNQLAVIENVIADSIPLPITALRTDLAVAELVDRIALQTDELITAVNFLEGDLCRSLGGELPPWDRGERASDRLVFRLDGIARRFLAGLQREPSRIREALNAWAAAARGAATETAEELLRQVPPAAIVGREVHSRQGGTGQDRLYRASTAEIHFRSQLRRILGTATEEGELAQSGTQGAS